MKRAAPLALLALTALAHPTVARPTAPPALIRSAPDSRGDPQAQAAAILAQPSFREARNRPAGETWLERRARTAWETLGRWLEWLFGARTSGALLSRSVLYALYFLAAAAAAAGLFQLSRRLPLGARRSPGAAAGDTDLLAADVADPLAQAQACAAAGDYRRAVRFAYIAALRRLRDRGLIVLERQRTNGEYQGALRPVPEVYARLLPATRAFDRVWYGRKPATSADFETVRQACESLAAPETPREESA